MPQGPDSPSGPWMVSRPTETRRYRRGSLLCYCMVAEESDRKYQTNGEKRMYLIRYAGCCLNGLVRAGNEDNYCCAGGYPPMVHGDIPLFEGAVFPGKASAFAVFDGMGGEKYGEKASFLAAREFAAAAGNEPDETALCRQMNRRILEFAARNHAGGCGTTAVTLSFGEEDIHGFNLGDSRCYRYSGRTLTALSTDHAVTSPVTRRARLTQCLGIPEEEFLLEPKQYRANYLPGDLYLLCSDGLTGPVSPVKIESVLSWTGSLRDKLNALRSLAFQRGAEDNITMILFEIDWEEV